MFQILHFADLHLDVSFAGIGFPSLNARKYRENIREALVRILDLAKEKNVQAITIAGDLYEQERFTRDTGEFLINQFQNVNPIKIFIAPGNHDPFVSDSLYQFLDWPENVTIFKTPEFTPVRLNSDITLWGMAHNSPSFRKNPLDNFSVPENGQHILLFHGSDTSSIPVGKTTHAPFIPEYFIKTGANLALVGHYHNGKLKSKEEQKLFYPGSPEPLGFGENNVHSVGLVTIENDKYDLEIQSINKFQFISQEINISKMNSSDQVKSEVENWAKLTGKETIYLKVNLVGEMASHIKLELEILNERMNEYCPFGLVVDQTHPEIDVLAIAEEKTVRGEFVRTMLAKIENTNEEEKDSLERTLHYGLMAFEGSSILTS